MTKEQKQTDIFRLVKDLSLVCVHLPYRSTYKKITSPKVFRFSSCIVSNFSSTISGGVLVISKEEMEFLKKCPFSTCKNILSKLNSMEVPLVILTKEVDLDSFGKYLIKKILFPVFRVLESVDEFEIKYKSYIEFYLGNYKLIHGVLMEVYGTGVLIIGRSGVGKSECALELIKRGHRFISDDAVKIKRLDNDNIVGFAPDNIRNFLELRGVGIINVKVIFGLCAVKQLQKVDLIIELIDWKLYESRNRLFVEQKSKNMLGIEVPLLQIPVSSGRSIPVIIETAVINVKGRSQGYDATESLIKNLREASI